MMPTGTIRLAGSPEWAKPSITDGVFISFTTLPNKTSSTGSALITRPVHKAAFETGTKDMQYPPEKRRFDKNIRDEAVSRGKSSSLGSTRINCAAGGASLSTVGMMLQRKAIVQKREPVDASFLSVSSCFVIRCHRNRAEARARAESRDGAAGFGPRRGHKRPASA